MGVVGSYGAGKGTPLRETEGDLLKIKSVLLPRKDNYTLSNPVNTDTAGSMETVHFNRVSVLCRFS